VEENVKAKLSKILSGLSGGAMKGKTAEISEFIKSKNGKELLESLSESDKKAIMQKFLSMDTSKIGEKLKNFDQSAIGNITADDVRKKLR
jgi:hypothetical protein